MRKVRSYSDKIPRGYSYPFLIQKRIAKKGIYGENDYDYQNLKVVYGQIKDYYNVELFTEDKSREVRSYKLFIRDIELRGENISVGDRFILLKDDYELQSFRIHKQMDNTLRREYKELILLEGAYTERSDTDNCPNQYFFKGSVSDLPVSDACLTTEDNMFFLTEDRRSFIVHVSEDSLSNDIKSLISNFHLSYASRIKDIKFIPNTELRPVLIFRKPHIEINGIIMEDGNTDYTLIREENDILTFFEAPSSYTSNNDSVLTFREAE